MNTRTPEIYGILASLAGVLLLATMVGGVLRSRRPTDAAIQNLNARIDSWWALVLTGGVALLAGRLAIIVLFGAISLLALREFFPRITLSAPFATLAILVTAAQYAFLSLGWYGFFVWGIPLLALAALVASSKTRAAPALSGLLLCVYCVSYVPALMSLSIPGYTSRAAVLMVFVVLIAQISDVCQYIWGKLLGRHLLIPALSPSKTVEGLVGGIFSSTLLGAVLWRLTPFTIVQAAMMSLLIAAAGFLGGLAMSAIKRRRGIKDWGSLIPGHGGILDRIDSLCFSAPVVFHVVRIFFSES